MLSMMKIAAFFLSMQILGLVGKPETLIFPSWPKIHTFKCFLLF
jgi:hypothetical protein